MHTWTPWCATLHTTLLLRATNAPLIRMSAGALVNPYPPTQMKEVNSTLYGWSWGELEFGWTTVGPFKVRALCVAQAS